MRTLIHSHTVKICYEVCGGNKSRSSLTRANLKLSKWTKLVRKRFVGQRIGLPERQNEWSIHENAFRWLFPSTVIYWHILLHFHRIIDALAAVRRPKRKWVAHHARIMTKNKPQYRFVCFYLLKALAPNRLLCESPYHDSTAQKTLLAPTFGWMLAERR